MCSTFPDCSTTVIIKHATTIWVLENIQIQLVEFGPLPGFVNELNWNKECALIE
jgi:hypothetical protein